MAASSLRKTNGPRTMLAFALLLIASHLNGVMTQEEEVVTGTAAPVEAAPYLRGDMIDPTDEPDVEPEDPEGQIMVLPSMESPETTHHAAEEVTTEEAGEAGEAGEADDAKFTVEIHTSLPVVMDAETPAAVPARGDGPNIKPQPMPKPENVVCVSKEAVQDKNAITLKLKASSSCEETKAKIEGVRVELCGEDCKLDIYQEDNSDQIVVSGKHVEADVPGMASKFNDNIKHEIEVAEVVPRWGKNSKLVLVSLLLTGLLLAALLVAAYYFKTHRKNSKGVRLAESFQVDEENQANTLVSVAPLPQEPVDKPPAVNGESSPPENGTSPSNGHSANQTPVADTEM